MCNGRNETAQRFGQLASVPDAEVRRLFSIEHFIGEGAGGARLNTLSLTMPISWREMPVQ